MYKDIRIVSITSTTTAQPIGKLINDRLTALSQSLPEKIAVLRIVIKPGANVTIQDIKTTDEVAVLSGVEKEYPVLNAHEKLLIKGAGTVLVELYLGDTDEI